MAIHVRPARWVTDKTAVIGLLRNFLSSESDEDRFHWLYEAGPHGPAMAWVACGADNGELIGAAAAFPRVMRFRGKRTRAWVLGDFCLNSAYRSLGPALQLQRSCLNGVTSNSAAFYYDFPSEAMMVIYRRLGIPAAGQLRRWARPLRIAPRLERIVRSRRLAKTIAVPADFVLKHRGRRSGTGGVEITVHQGPCGNEFSQLNERLGIDGMCTDRTSEYLNWRYVHHPSVRHEILTAQCDGNLIGFIVTCTKGDEGRIVDMSAEGDANLVASLLTNAIDRLRDCGLSTVSMNAGSRHPWSDTFRRVGLRERESTPVVARFSSGCQTLTTGQFDAWHLMQGERDS